MPAWARTGRGSAASSGEAASSGRAASSGKLLHVVLTHPASCFHRFSSVAGFLRRCADTQYSPGPPVDRFSLSVTINTVCSVRSESRLCREVIGSWCRVSASCLFICLRNDKIIIIMTITILMIIIHYLYWLSFEGCGGSWSQSHPGQVEWITVFKSGETSLKNKMYKWCDLKPIRGLDPSWCHQGWKKTWLHSKGNPSGV